jgi:hypothetical protein
MVEVIVTDKDGKVVERVAVNEDLFNYVVEKSRENNLDMGTIWFLRILRGIFWPTLVGSANSETYTDTSGTSRTQNFKNAMYTSGATSPYLSNFFNTGYCPNRLWISYGNSSTPPTRTDYKLGNKLGEGITTITLDEPGGILTLSVSFTFSTDTTIYEVGLEWEACVASYNTCGRVLLDRTVFPNGITVLAGQTISIVYRFFLP